MYVMILLITKNPFANVGLVLDRSHSALVEVICSRGMDVVVIFFESLALCPALLVDAWQHCHR